MSNWYLGSTKHTAIAQFAVLTGYVIGDIVRQLAAPSVGNERAFRCTTAGTSGASEPSWNLTKGSTTSTGSAVFTEVTGNNTYGWGAAGARLALFLTSSWAAAGDTVYRSNNHAETQSTGMTLTSPGTAANPVSIVTVNDSAAPPTALATTANITVTGTSSISFGGFAWDYGCTYTIGTGSGVVNANFNASTPNYWRLESGAFVFGSTGVGQITIGVNASGLDDRLIEFINENVSFNAAGGGFNCNGNFNWFGGTLSGTTVTNLFANVTTGPGGVANVVGVDLSILNAGESLVAQQQGQSLTVNFENCDVDSNAAIVSGTNAGQGGVVTRVVHCGRDAYHDYLGTVTNDATVFRANDSLKIVTTANTKIFKPLVLDAVIYNNVTLSTHTISVEIINDGLTLTDADIWIEAEVLATGSSPQSTFVSGRIADPIFGTPTNVTSSGVSWTNGLGSPVTQKLEVSVTPAEIGLIKLRVMVARPTTTLYVDPKVI